MRPLPFATTLIATTLALALALAGCVRSRPGPAPSPTLVTLEVASTYALASLDPHAANTLGPVEVLFNVYEGLVRFDSQLRVRPALAESWESPDASTWVFHIIRELSSTLLMSVLVCAAPRPSFRGWASCQ